MIYDNKKYHFNRGFLNILNLDHNKCYNIQSIIDLFPSNKSINNLYYQCSPDIQKFFNIEVSNISLNFLIHNIKHQIRENIQDDFIFLKKNNIIILNHEEPSIKKFMKLNYYKNESI